MGNKRMGRPLMFETPEILQEKIDDYFKSISIQKPLLIDGQQAVNGLGELMYETHYFFQPTITGLSMYLNTSRETLCNYEKKDEFYDVVKIGKLRIENAYENRLIEKGRTADIFGLKAMGWKDKHEVKVDTYNHEAPPTIIDDSDNED